MKPLTREWIGKAEGDFATAGREVRARKAPNYDAACFHAQQCIEKYLKARLQEAGLPFGRMHDLPALLNLLLPVEPSWEFLRPHLRALTPFAVRENATKILIAHPVHGEVRTCAEIT
jgi:HEPN domain-containing protein